MQFQNALIFRAFSDMLSPVSRGTSTHFLRFVQRGECEWSAILRVTSGTHQFSLDFLSKWLEINLTAMSRGFESHRLRQRQHPAGCCFLFLRQTMQGLQGGIRTARARRFASRRAATVLRTAARARENPTACAKYHYSILHWVVIFYFCFEKFRCFSYKYLPFIFK